jgi:CO/xanthine dehydrogenase FAD-binding subunit
MYNNKLKVNMKYLLMAALAILSVSVSAQEDSDLYHGVSYNQDVTRKFNLANPAAIEVVTDVRFKPLSGDAARTYYHIIPSTLSSNVVSVSAIVATSQNKAKV